MPRKTYFWFYSPIKLFVTCIVWAGMEPAAVIALSLVIKNQPSLSPDNADLFNRMFTSCNEIYVIKLF